MDNFPMSYREVIPDQTNPLDWKEIALNTGATQSTLQDIKVAEKAGGYCYRPTSIRNRFIYWRTQNDVLELTEISLDFNLQNNCVRYKFTDSPVLSVSICENQNKFVVVLVATVSSIHRLSFVHPVKNNGSTNDAHVARSVFYDASSNSTRDPSTFHVIAQPTSTHHPIPHTAASWLTASGEEAMFSMAFQTNLMLFTMNCTTGHTSSVELRQHYIVPRMFSNITGALRGKSNSTDSNFATSIVFNDIGGQTFVYALYRDDHVRMWSTVNGQCVATINCVPDGTGPRPQGPQTNALRRAAPDTVCAFLCYSMGSEFVNIQTQWDGANVSLNRKSFVQAPQFDLVDFELNESRIWALWCNAQGEYNTSSYSLVPGLGSVNWVHAAPEPITDGVQVDHGMDPKDTYCSHIFHPGRFQRDVIAKAMVMFRRSTILAEDAVSMSVLKDRVCQTVEREIQSEIKDFDITDEEYIDVSAKLWERFYSCCEQYHVKATQPLGLVIMDSMASVCLIKKHSFSVLRPCELLEHLMMSSTTEDGYELNFFQDTSIADDNLRADDDVIRLVSALVMLENQIPDEIKKTIHDRLYQLHMPNAVVAALVSDMLSTDFEDTVFPRSFLNLLHQKIKSISNLKSTMVSLLDTLRMDQPVRDANKSMESFGETSQSTRLMQALGSLFGSDIGISTVAESLRQIVLIRYSLCRNLLILQQILIEKFDLPCHLLEDVRSSCMPNTVVFVQAYFVMVWICETPTLPRNQITGRSMRSQILRGRTGYLAANQPISVLDQFLYNRGLQCGRAAFVEINIDNFSETQWQYTLLPLSLYVGQLVWAVSGDFVFGEWLIESGQHTLLLDYVRLLNGWCEWNNCSRHFIAAVSFLESGETHKAFDLFMQAAKGVLSESFLSKFITQTPEQLMDENESMTLYYLKVIQLFEQHAALDHIISLAKTAIGILDKDNTQMAMFQSIVFTNHLQLGHYDEAYHTLINNSESSRRKDCLRQLVIGLFQQKRLDLLMRFPYIRLKDELEEIIESRARSMAIEGNQYYDFLYAFHVTKENMRKASSIMYEQAMRYQLECDSTVTIQCRYDCLLSCLNALHLVHPDYAWIAKPVINDDDTDLSDNMDTDKQQQVVVLEIKDIRRELVLTEAVLALAKHRQDLPSILNADSSQIIGVMASSGMYTAAVKLATRLDQKSGVITALESLSLACVRADDNNPDETWNWLRENDLADIPHSNSAVDMTWRLLQMLIDEHEANGSTELRNAVATKLISVGEFLPYWLQTSYKRSNTSELLNLYVNHGRLIEATQLAVEYIRAMIGAGGEYFGLANSLQSNRPALCFPVHAVDLLKYGLTINSQHDKEYEQCLHELTDVVQGYCETASRVSHNKVEYLVQMMKTMS